MDSNPDQRSIILTIIIKHSNEQNGFSILLILELRTCWNYKSFDKNVNKINFARAIFNQNISNNKATVLLIILYSLSLSKRYNSKLIITVNMWFLKYINIQPDIRLESMEGF